MAMNINASPEYSSATSGDPIGSHKQYPGLELALEIVRKWSPIVVAIFGIFGNVTSALVTTKKEYRHISTCVYMTALAILDTTSLVFGISHVVMLSHGYGVHLESYETIAKAINYLIYSASMSSRLVLAAMTVDRACAVLFPFKARRLCTASRAKKAVIFVTVFEVAIDVNMFFTFKLILVGTKFANFVLDFKDTPWLEPLVAFFHLAIGTVVPFLLILISNILIITRVNRAASSRSKMTESDNRGENEKSVADKHLTRMLILVSIAYLLLCTPPAMYELVFSIPQVKAVYDMRDIYWLYRMNIIHWTMATVAMLNHSINFFLYILGGGRKFREDAKKALTVCCRSSD